MMREARAKLRLIKPDDMDMDEYLVPSITWKDQVLTAPTLLRENPAKLGIEPDRSRSGFQKVSKALLGTIEYEAQCHRQVEEV